MRCLHASGANNCTTDKMHTNEYMANVKMHVTKINKQIVATFLFA